MKCKYCDNEIANATATECPFCGASIDTPEQRPSIALQSPQGSIEAMCPYCKTIYEIEIQEVGTIGKCECCGKKFELKRHTTKTSPKKLVGRPEKILSWLRKFKKIGSLPEVDREKYDFRPLDGESVYCVINNVRLSESRQVGWSQSESVGVGLMSFDEHSDYAESLSLTNSISKSGTRFASQFVCAGRLMLTSKRILFVGGHNRIFLLKDVVSFESNWVPQSGMVRISASGFDKGMEFSGNKVMEFAIYYNILVKPKFREFIMQRDESTVIAKLMKLGFYYTPPPQVVDDNTKSNGYGPILLFVGAFIVFILFCLLVL